MHAETFLREFAPLASGPGAVQKLRELVLQLAVRGKLVPQIAGEVFSQGELQTASEFIKQVRANRYKELTLSEPFNELPVGWIATPLGNVIELVNGRAFKPSDWTSNGLKIVRIQNLNNSTAPFNRYDGEVRDRFLIEDGNLLVSWSGTPGTSFGAFIWNGGKAILNQHIFRADFSEAALHTQYVRLAVDAVMNDLISDAVGSAGLQHVRRGQIENSVLLLPPIAEQKRIVAKVDELMALCDALEARQVEETGLKRAAAASALHNLTEAKGPQEITNGWPTVAENFCRLFDDVENIKELRSTVLQQAYLGAFNDEKPAYTPLEEILAFGPRNGFSPKPARSATDIRSITLSAVTRGKFDQSKFKYIDEVIGEESHLWLAENDLLIQRANSLEHVGSSTVVQGLSGRYIYPDLIMKMQLLEGFDPQYILYCLQSPSLRTHFRINATGTSGSMPKINQKVVKSALIPIVSSQAQCTTVNRTSNLMALCDRLEEQVREGEQLNAELMASLIHALTETDPDGGGATKAMGLFEGVPETAPPEQADKGTTKTPVNKGVLVHSNPEPEVEGAPVRPLNVDTKFQEAVLVAAIVNTFFETGGEPIGNFRLQKAVYFARRKMGEHVGEMAYLKKAAGPYNPAMKYSGGIAIAKRKSWLREARGRFGFGHVPGAEVTDAAEWIETYGYGEPARWVADHFRYKKNDEWETLATVDYAVEHLRSLDIDPDAEQILQYIASDTEWHPKIEKLGLTEMSVGTAMLEVAALFNPEGKDESV